MPKATSSLPFSPKPRPMNLRTIVAAARSASSSAPVPQSTSHQSATSLLLGLALALASLALAAWTFADQVLAPDHSQETATTVLASSMVSDHIDDLARTALADLAGSDQVIEPEAMDAAAHWLHTSSDLEARINQRLASAHTLGLQGQAVEPQLADSDLTATARSALSRAVPGVDLKPFAEQGYELDLPVEGFELLARLNGPIRWLQTVGLGLALLAAAAALALSHDRPTTCRAAAPWAFGSAAGLLIAAMAFQAFHRSITPEPFLALGQLLANGMSALTGPAAIVGASGVGLLAFGALWPAYQRRRGAAMLAGQTLSSSFSG